MGLLKELFWDSDPKENEEIPNEYRENLNPSSRIKELEGLFNYTNKSKRPKIYVREQDKTKIQTSKEINIQNQRTESEQKTIEDR